MEEKKIGKVVGYFAKIGVAAVQIEDGELRIGDIIHIKGHTTDLTQQVTSMQIEKQPVEEVKPGDAVGIKVEDRVRKGDTVYKVIEG